MDSPENARRPHIWPVSLIQNDTKMSQINRPWLKCNRYWRWSGYTSTSNFRPFLPCIAIKCKNNSNWRRNNTRTFNGVANGSISTHEAERIEKSWKLNPIFQWTAQLINYFKNSPGENAAVSMHEIVTPQTVILKSIIDACKYKYVDSNITSINET